MAFALPCNEIKWSTKSSGWSSPVPSSSRRVKISRALETSMSLASRNSRTSSCPMSVRRSSQDTMPARSLSISIQHFTSCSTRETILWWAFSTANSLIFVADSMAAFTKTPFRMFSTQSNVNTMYKAKNSWYSIPNSAKSSDTSAQSRPPVTDAKRVKVVALRPPKFFIKFSCMAGSTPGSRRYACSPCMNIEPNTNMTTDRRRIADAKAFQLPATV
mmetsp:Transcript_43243/g.115885  ORF Transcript_43243/g.115885 Transcript_43243/m.115885 type:complete len:217 (-) Transcript_43243:369-1019(-)